MTLLETIIALIGVLGGGIGLAKLFGIIGSRSNERENDLAKREDRLYEWFEEQIGEMRDQHDECRRTNEELMKRIETQTRLIVEQSTKIDALQRKVEELQREIDGMRDTDHNATTP